MARVRYAGAANERGREFLELFDQLTYSRSAWQVWEDLMIVMACSICNAVDCRKGPFERRERQYERSIEALGGVDIPAQMFSIVTMAFEEDPGQDLLGQLYMSLNLGSHWHGQFFTPYHISELMARMTIGEDCQREIREKGYISVCDPCVGAGAMLIAAVQAFQGYGVDYQTSVLFVGQDIDPVVAKMAYIQLSLLGCPGYIIVGDSLKDPPTGHVLFPHENEGREVWITPMFMHQAWEIRRTGVLMQRSLREIVATERTRKKERYFMFFRSDRKEQDMRTMEVNLQSPKVRERLERGAQVRHFKMGSEPDAGYGETWGAVVRAYLREGYESEGDEKEIKVAGVLYKILVRRDDTVFYDADGATLFDVENRRLEAEYGEMMQQQETVDVDCSIRARIEQSGESDLRCSGDIKRECSSCEKAADPAREPNVEDLDAVDMREQAKKRLEGESKKVGEGTVEAAVLRYLLERCAEDRGLAQDVMQEHKTWERCLAYIYGQAKAQIPKDKKPVYGVIGVQVCDETAYEWAEDYYHKDDKAEGEEKARKEAERKEEQKKVAADKAAKADKRSSKAVPAPKKKKEKPKGQLRPKKSNKDMDGQLDMFSMMGM